MTVTNEAGRDALDEVLGRIRQEVENLESELTAKKKMANSLSEMYGLDPLYSGVEEEGPKALRADEFYGQPLSTVVRKVLKRVGSASTVRAIYETMVAGGFKFDAKNDDNAIRSLRISLTKNAATFHRLPNGTYGLLEWYPSVRGRSSTASSSESPKENTKAVNSEPPSHQPSPNGESTTDDTAGSDPTVR